MNFMNVSICNWCLREAPVRTIEERLWRFWGIISNEYPPVASLRNICGTCTTRYEEFSRYIDTCKRNESIVEMVLAAGIVKDEPTIDIEYQPLIKVELSEGDGTAETARRGSASYIPKTSAQRSKEFRERRKLIRPTHDSGKKTNAQKCKEYRERKKLSQAAAPNEGTRKSSKSSAQRSKEFRERRKLSRASQDEVKQKNAQKCKEYRERKKLSQAIAPNEETRKVIKSNAQRSKEYRQRRKLALLHSLNRSNEGTSGQRKTNALHCKEYRERLKLKKLLSTIGTETPSDEKRSAGLDGILGSDSGVDDGDEVLRPIKLEEDMLDYCSLANYDDNIFNRNESRSNQTYGTAEEGSICKAHHVLLCNDDSIKACCSQHRNVNDYASILGVQSRQNESSETHNMAEVGGNTNRIRGYEPSRIVPVDESMVERIERYSRFDAHASAHLKFFEIFKNNAFGHPCAICDRLCWKNDLKSSSESHGNILKDILPNYAVSSPVDICSTCKAALDKGKIPAMSTYNGFTYPTIPPNLPALDIVSQRLISPRIPFVQIRRLGHVHGEYGIYGQVINVPVDVDAWVNKLPRSIDHCCYVHIKKKSIPESNYINGLVDKGRIKEWLTYLVTSPLYAHHNITIDETFFDKIVQDVKLSDFSEDVAVEDRLVAQRQTLLWNENDVSASGENNVPFDEYEEELSFPTIYGGQFRRYKENARVTPFMQAASELRRTDRRGADPQHLLYLASKIMRLRIKDCVSNAYIRTDTNVTGAEVRDTDYRNVSIETAFLHCIPYSAQYWFARRKDLLGIMRQKGAPTAYMSLRCNEMGWPDLLKLLYRLKNAGADVSDETLSKMTDIQKATLINEDVVTCAIYFDKLVSSLMHILQAKKRSPFGKYRVMDYFQRIEFERQGSPRAHILLWLENVPDHLSSDFVTMIDELVSVSAPEASGNIELQTHQHASSCYETTDPNKRLYCRFGAPFMPSKETVTLLPMKETDPDYSAEDFERYKNHFKTLRENLEKFDYTDFDYFYTHNNIESDRHYHNILRAGIDGPKLFHRRLPSEKWHNPYNPFVLHHFKSNMDFRPIQGESACAAYVVKYFSKPNVTFSDLRKQIIEIMDKNPGSDIAEMTRKLNVDLINTIEISAQEAAWYLLRMPMAKSTVPTVYIPTTWPNERPRIRKPMKRSEAMDVDRTDNEDWFGRYEQRPAELGGVSLAQFVSKYLKNGKGRYVVRKKPNVITYRNYDKVENSDDHKREMVLLYVPFRNEENDVLSGNKFLQIYEDNEDLIKRRRKEFESDLDIGRILRLIERLEKNDDEEDSE